MLNNFISARKTEFLFQKLKVSLIDMESEKPACINPVLSFLYSSQVTTIFATQFYIYKVLASAQHFTFETDLSFSG